MTVAQPCLHGVNVCETVNFAVQPRLSRGRESGRGSSNEGPPSQRHVLPLGLRRSFVTQMYAITSISTSEFPGMPPAAAMVVRTGGSAPKRPWNTSFMPL